MARDSQKPKSERFDWPQKAIFRLRTVVKNDQTLIVAGGSPPRSLQVIDISDAKAPKEIAEMNIGLVMDLFIVNDLCYACTLEEGLVSVDLSVPSSPRIQNKWGSDLPALPCSVAPLSPPKGREGLNRIALALRALPTEEEAKEWFMVEGYASSAWITPPQESTRKIETEGDLGLLILEHRFGENFKESERGFFQIGYRAYPKLNQLKFEGYHQPWEVSTIGNLAFLAVGRSGLFLYDLNRLDLKDAGSEFCPGERVRGVKAAGKHLLLTGDGRGMEDSKVNGFMVLDCSNMAQPQVVYPWKERGTPLSIRSTLFAGGLLLLHPFSFSFYELPELSLPRLAVHHELAQSAKTTDIIAVAGTICIASEDGSIKLFRIQNPEYLGLDAKVEHLTTVAAH